MRRVMAVFFLCLGAVVALSLQSHADYARTGSIPVTFPEAPPGYAVTGLDAAGDRLFMTVAVDSNSAIYLVDPLTGGTLTSYIWQYPMPDGLGAPSFSGAAFEGPSYYWVCDARSGCFLDLYWAGGDTLSTYTYWTNDRIQAPGGLVRRDNDMLWTVQGGGEDSLYEVTIGGYVSNAYSIQHSGRAAAVTGMPGGAGPEQVAHLLVCYDGVPDTVFEYTDAGTFIRAHHLAGSPFVDGITAATFYDGKLYLGGVVDSLYIFENVESYAAPVPAGDSITVHVIPDELDIKFTHVAEAGTVYVEVRPEETCAPPGGVNFLSDYYEMHTTASFDYLAGVEITPEAGLPDGPGLRGISVFVRPSGECDTWRDITVAPAQIVGDARSRVLARITKTFSEDDEFSVFAVGEDGRNPTSVVALKFDYLDSAITHNQESIPPTAYARMTNLLARARTAYGAKRHLLAARDVGRIAEIAYATPEIPHTYDPEGAPGGNVAGRIMSRAHTLSFSLARMLRTYELAPYVGPADDGPTIGVMADADLGALGGPNPSSADFILSFTCSGKHPVSVKVYSVEGRLVRTLTDGDLERGTHTVTWNCRNDQGEPVASGAYFAVVDEAGGRAVTKLMLRR